MFKKIILALAALLVSAAAFAAVDANRASQAELEAIKGIGPVISTLIVNERKKGNFKDWNDLVTRVKGVGDKSAEKFSEGGLTVNGATFTGAPVRAPAKADPPMTAKVASAAKGGAEKAASATKATASKAASAVKGGAAVATENAKEEKTALKDSAADAKAKRAEKKAEKAEKKAEAKAEKAASASAAASGAKKK